jgi:hypothetical protein
MGAGIDSQCWFSVGLLGMMAINVEAVKVGAGDGRAPKIQLGAVL